MMGAPINSVDFSVERATRASRVASVVGIALFAAALTLPWWGNSGWMREVVEISCYLVS